jgi:excinuclease UvrABC ATPase subunit
MIDCPKCEGSGFRSVESSSTYNDIEYNKPNIQAPCIACKGTRQVTKLKAFHINKKYK